MSSSRVNRTKCDELLSFAQRKRCVEGTGPRDDITQKLRVSAP
jgi:hypothetical protein